MSTTRARQVRHSRRAALSILALGGLGLAATASACTIPLPFVRVAERPFNGATLSPPTQLPELTLQRADGRSFSTAATRGRLSLMFFGYTHCPDVCPLTLFHIAQIRKQLGPTAAGIDAYFVTVDPERDTPARLAEYVAKFDSAIVPLTGTPEELDRFRSAFGVVAEKRPVPNSAVGYFVDHTGSTFLLDRESRIALIYQYGTEDDLIVDDLRRLAAR